ncbi:MAG: LytR/AlgR family response regulator transcription factor [Flavobacteriales bacterium]
MNCIIVDDDNDCIKALSGILKSYCPQVTIAGTATSIAEAVSLINTAAPDVVFLDVEIHDETGFDLFTYFTAPTFEVVFTTAHEKYALRAIKASCFDFLLKPVIIQEVVNVLAKLEKEKQKVSADKVNVLIDNITTDKTSQRKIAIPSSDGYVFLNTNDIICLEADGKYTKITASTGSLPLSTRNIGEFEEILDPALFFRTHKSWIINVGCVKKFLKTENQVLLSNDMLADVSTRKKEEFLRLFSKG